MRALTKRLLPVLTKRLLPVFLKRSRMLALTLALLTPPSCQRGAPATQEECARLFGRLVDLELQEMGYRDPTLAARWRARLAARHAPLVESCVGRRLPPGALACAARARTAEEVSHGCLDVGW